MYVTGKGVPQNYVLAAQLYQQAAEQGNIEAQYSLAWLYKNGKGVPKNLATAEQWRQQATTVRVGAEQAIANINTRDTIALTPEQKQQKQAHDILD
jgi:TPR repeat protein